MPTQPCGSFQWIFSTMKLWRRSKCGEIKCVKKQLRSEEHLRLFIARRPALHSFRLNKVQLQHPRGSGLIKRASEGFILRPTVSKHDVNVSNYTRGLETHSDRLITFTRVWWRVDAAAELKRGYSHTDSCFLSVCITCVTRVSSPETGFDRTPRSHITQTQALWNSYYTNKH